MSVFDTLRLNIAQKIAPAPAATQGNTQTASPAAPQHPPVEGDPSQPNQQSQMNGATTAAQTAATEANPLDSFKDLFAPVKVDPAAPAQPTQAVDFDAAEIQKGLAQMDFAGKFIDPKDMAAIAAGGEGAVTAFGNAMNSVMRNTLMMSSQYASQSANKAAAFAQERANSALPELVRGQLTSNEFNDSASQHPALQPLVKVLTTQFQQQHPKASPADIAKHVRTYLQAVGGALNPQSEDAKGTQKAQAGESDWNSWFGTSGAG